MLIEEKLNEKFKSLKGIAFDVDGVLTTGQVFWTGQTWSRFWDVSDGFGIKLLLRNGIKVAFITAGNNDSVSMRAKQLGVTQVYQGLEDKLKHFNLWLKESGLDASDVAFVGDEIFDLPTLQAAGFSMTVPDAPLPIKEKVDFVTLKNGGHGAVREICERILAAKGIDPYDLKSVVFDQYNQGDSELITGS